MTKLIISFFLISLVFMNVYSNEALDDADFPTFINIIIDFSENALAIGVGYIFGNIGTFIISIFMVLVGIVALFIRIAIGDSFEQSLDNFISNVYKAHHYLNEYNKEGSNNSKYLHKANIYIKKTKDSIIAIDSKRNRINLQEVLPAIKMLYDYMRIPLNEKDYRSLASKAYSWYKQRSKK